MADQRVKKLADILVTYSVNVQPGDKVAIMGNLVTRPLMVEIYRAVIRAGGHPLAFWQDDEMQEIFFKEGNEEQLGTVPDVFVQIVKTYDCLISLWGSANTRNLSNIDPAKMQLNSVAEGELSDIILQRSAAGELRWVGAMFPTPAFAQEADMSLTEYEDFVYGTCFVDKENPIVEWNRVHEEQQRLIDWLDGKERVRIKGPNADLTLSIAGRRFINSDGHKNMPSGEIFTSPVEDSAEGWIRFTYPAIYSAREVEGIELHFKNGKVVAACAKKNEAFLLNVLDTDEGSRYLGEFAIGTNNGIKQFTKSILFDEKIGGSIHLAVGLGFPEANGKNTSAVHWDMICDMRDGGKIWVDDELFYDSGEFVIQ
ncbi:MAG: aminopeptidase [Anaerolineae bacterium]|nr:aminopeptidase [Anaerolineae bacterium]MCO5189899.1 aminopeptidase [Anaerolineae bacterium]